MGKDLTHCSTIQGTTTELLTSYSALASDSKGNLYVTDTNNYRIRKIALDGTVSTVAGTGKRGYQDGKVEEAQFGYCYGVAVGEDGTLFASDNTNCVIRRIKDGVVTTLAGKGRESSVVDGRYTKPHLQRLAFPCCCHRKGSTLMRGTNSTSSPDTMLLLVTQRE